MEGHAVPGGAHVEIRPPREGARLDPERGEEEGLPQIRLWAHGRRRYGQPSGTVDQRATPTYLQIRRDQRRETYRPDLRLHAERLHGRHRLRWIFERSSIPRARAVQGFVEVLSTRKFKIAVDLSNGNYIDVVVREAAGRS